MKTTLDLPSDLVREIKRLGVTEGRRLADVAADLLRRGLNRRPGGQSLPSKKPRVDIQADGLPLVVSYATDIPASKMTAEELVALEQGTLTQEDLLRLGVPL